MFCFVWRFYVVNFCDFVDVLVGRRVVDIFVVFVGVWFGDWYGVVGYLFVGR